MTYSPFLLLHIAGGMLAILSGFAAVFVRKGSPLHRRTGNVFTVSMLCMAGGGAYLAFLKWQEINIVAGLFTVYLVSTAWLVVKRRNGKPGRAELGLMGLALVVALFCMTLGWQAVQHPPVHKGGGPTSMYFIFGTIVLLAATGDMRMFLRGGVTGAQRMVRHLWRMNFSLFIATASFFVGGGARNGLRARLFTKAVRATYLPTVPVFFVLILMIYWIIRVKFGKQYKRAGESRPQRSDPMPSIPGNAATAGGSQ
jgi:uncharacterized membrane protein